MDILPDELLIEVVKHITQLQDLLHAARICKRLEQAVRSSEDAWEGLFKRTFPEQPRTRAAVKEQQRSQPGPSQKQLGPSILQSEQSLQSALVHSTSKQVQHGAATPSFLSVPPVQQQKTRKHVQQQQQQQQRQQQAHGHERRETHTTWYNKFKERYMAEATTKRLERRVALLKARSAVAHLTRTIAEVKAAAGREREKLQGYEAEASRLQHMIRVAAVAPPERSAGTASGAQGRHAAHEQLSQGQATQAAAAPVWVPGAVQEAWGRLLTSQGAVDPQTRLNQIKGDTAAARVQLKVLQAQLEARQAELEVAKRKVKTLETT